MSKFLQILKVYIKDLTLLAWSLINERFRFIDGEYELNDLELWFNICTYLYFHTAYSKKSLVQNIINFFISLRIPSLKYDCFYPFVSKMSKLLEFFVPPKNVSTSGNGKYLLGVKSGKYVGCGGNSYSNSQKLAMATTQV